MYSVQKQLMWMVAAVVLAVPAGAVVAGSLDVSYTYTGTAGDYTLDFTVSNNLTSQPETFVSLFGVDLSQFGADLSNNVAVIAAPAGFSTDFSDPSSPWNNYKFGYGGRDFDWINHWNAIGTPVRTGTSLSGFLVHTNAQVLPTTVNWFAFAYSVIPSGPKPPFGGEPQVDPLTTDGAPGTQPFYDSTVESTPGSTVYVTTLGFEGGAQGFEHAVPEPTSLTLAGLGVLGTLLYGFRRGHVTAA